MSKKKIENIGLSNKEKELIQMLNHPEFTVEYIEDWVKNPPKTAYEDAAIALYKGRIEGYLAAVQQLKQSNITRRMHESYANICRQEDIISVIEENADEWEDVYRGIDFNVLMNDESFIQEVLQNFEHHLGRNDYYWEAYWDSARCAVENALDKRFPEKAVA